MIEIQVSSAVQASLARHIPALGHASISHSWSAHAFNFVEQDCLIVMERHSGYVMLFFNLTEDDYQNFSRVWQLRVLTEAIAVADVDSEQEQALKEKMINHFQDVLVTDGVNHAIDGQLQQIEGLVKALMVREKKVPTIQLEEFRWGVIINDYAQRQSGLTPYEKMQHQWQMMAETPQLANISIPATVLH